MTTNYSGRTTSYSHKFDNWQENKSNGKDPLRMQRVLDVQWTDCPVEVENEVKEIWSNYGLGNDCYFKAFCIRDMDGSYPLVTEYLLSRGVEETEAVWIHWWW